MQFNLIDDLKKQLLSAGFVTGSGFQNGNPGPSVGFTATSGKY